MQPFKPYRRYRLLFGICLLLFTLGGCSSFNIKTYNGNEIDSRLPINIGDEVLIRVHDQSKGYLLIVSAVDELKITGNHVADPEQVSEVRWQDISELEVRKQRTGLRQKEWWAIWAFYGLATLAMFNSAF